MTREEALALKPGDKITTNSKTQIELIFIRLDNNCNPIVEWHLPLDYCKVIDNE